MMSSQGVPPSGTRRSQRPKLKPVACRKCHERKVRCSGGQPCRSCIQLKCGADCTYPKRDRQVRVNQSYIDELLCENERLGKELSRRSGEARSDNTLAETYSAVGSEQGDQSLDEPSRNPIVPDRPWFLHLQSTSVPIIIGEVANAVFATRVRQVLTGTTLNHIPRTSYPSDAELAELASSPCPRIAPTQARFLVRAALKFLQGQFHIVRNSSVWELLDQYLRAPQSLGPLCRWKVLAVLALGELYSSNFQSPGARTPGLAYFAHASRAYGFLQERPSVEAIEVSLLLCLYALAMNRRHTAYFFSNSAVRQCIVMGLHFNLPESQLADAAAREHLNRIWWSSYVLDHTSEAITSHIVSIADAEVFADLPSGTRVEGSEAGDFENTDCTLARIGLARITRRMIQSVYGRAEQRESFLQRVQYALRDLKQWLGGLPPGIRMDSQASPEQAGPAQSLHLAFNQSVILTTRPVLFHRLRIHKESNGNQQGAAESPVSDTVNALAEACIRCARHSYTSVLDSWVEGSFRTFDFFRTQRMFSAATVLLVAGVLGGNESGRDLDDFELACHLLKKLSDAGSYTATELYPLLEALKTDVGSFSDDKDQPDSTAREEFAVDPNGSSHLEVAARDSRLITSGMALAEPSLEAFLLQSEQSLAEMNDFFDNTQIGDLYWPMYDFT